MSTFTSTGISRPRTDAGTLTFDTSGTTVVLVNATPYALDALAAAALEAREQAVERLPDECRCDGRDLPLFDHDRLCPRRVLAYFREIPA